MFLLLDIFLINLCWQHPGPRSLSSMLLVHALATTSTDVTVPQMRETSFPTFRLIDDSVFFCVHCDD